MENNEEIVSNETENVEQQTTEENVDDSTESDVVEDATSKDEPVEEPSKEEEEKVRTYTDEEVDEIVKRRLARQDKKIRREYDKRYSKLGNVLNAGLGTSNLEEATTKLEDFYKEKGINIPDSYEPKLSEDDIEVLANKEAEDIISSGYNDIVDEVDRLANIGVDKMSHRERIVFNKLAETRKSMEEEKELASIGVFKEQIEDKNFQDFAKKLNPSMSLKEKYEMYQSVKPKKEIKQIGSMKNDIQKPKDYYSPEEIAKLSEEQLDDPKIWEIVRKSMTKDAKVNYF